jgi:hypothetical protein
VRTAGQGGPPNRPCVSSDMADGMLSPVWLTEVFASSQVQLFVNGELCGTVDGVSLPLPKEYFGSKQRALHGCLQDVRTVSL